MGIRGTIRIAVALAWLALSSDAAAQGIEDVLYETFDGVEAPELPPGWTVTEGAWETSASTPSQASGANNLFARGSGAGTLTFPPVNLVGALSAEISYLARRTSAYDLFNMRIVASIDGGATFPFEVAAPGLALPTATSAYELMTVPIPAALMDQADVVLQIETFGNSSSGANLRLDDIRVSATRLVIVRPLRLSFVAMPGGQAVQTVEVTNADAAPLQVDPPLIGGTTFTASPATPVLIPPGETQPYVVTWSPLSDAPEARTLLLSHEHGTTAIELEGETAGGFFGFAVDSSVADPGRPWHEVPATLAFAHPAGLQGLQFHVTWDDSLMHLVDVVRGTSVADTSAWTLAYHVDSLGATVVLLGSGSTALSAGTTDSLLTLRFTVPDTTAEADFVHVALSQVVGALAMPGGDDARLFARPDAHVVSLRPGESLFALDPAELVLPSVLVGDTTLATALVSNPGGTVPLVVDSIEVSNALFVVDPESLVVLPDSSVVVTVYFAPTDSAFGVQHSTIVFHHNGNSGTDSLRVTGTGLGGRGDVTADGIVDVVDLVLALDFVLQRVVPDSLQRKRADSYPFPGGDGGLDVRDLTVLSHAIVNGIWPDSVALPAIEDLPGATEALLAALDGSFGSALSLEESWTLALETDVPVRALQVVLDAERIRDVRTVAGAQKTSSVTTLFSRTETMIRVVSYRTDGGMLEAGTYELLEVEPEEDGGRVRPLYVIGVDGELKRVPVAVAGIGGKDAENEVPGDILRLGVPYPNPVQFSEGKRLRLPLVGRPSDGRGRAAVFNILGQRVRRLTVPEEREAALEWDGQDERGSLVSPGIYFIRLEGAPSPVRSVIVLR